MKRRFERLLDGPFDLLVIGGGIYGAWAAYDAAMRGLQVALVEQDDWAAGTSSASSKLIHGGLRYLERGHLRLVRTALDERRRLVRLAPHRVWPRRFALPVYAGARVGRLRLKAGLWLYDRLSGRDQPVRGHRSFSRETMLERYPFLAPDGLRGGFSYGDCQTDDARFTLEVVAGAIHFGVAACNHARVQQLLLDGTRVAGARVLDRETEATVEVRADVTLNCAGPWIQKLIQQADDDAPPATRLSKGVHLLLPALPSDEAVLSVTDDGRVLFLLPWYGRTLVGTTDTDYRGAPGHARPEIRDVAYLLAEANRCLAGRPWEMPDVIGSFAGLRALPVSNDAAPSTVSREWSLIQTPGGLLSSVGGKYTSARADAARAVDRVLKVLGRPARECATDEQPFAWAPRDAWTPWRAEAISRGLAAGLDEETATGCVRRYGTSVDLLLDSLAEEPELGRRIVGDAAFCRGEILHAVRHEMARTLIDVLRRRIPLLLVARTDADAVADAATLAARVLPWDARRRQHEVNSILLGHRAFATGTEPS